MGRAGAGLNHSEEIITGLACLWSTPLSLLSVPSALPPTHSLPPDNFTCDFSSTLCFSPLVLCLLPAFSLLCTLRLDYSLLPPHSQHILKPSFAMTGSRLEDRQSEERLISSFDEENFLKDNRSPGARRSRWCQYQPNGTLILSVWTLFLFIASAYLWSTIARHRKTVAACQSDDFLPIDSPALEAVKNTGHIEKFDGSFAKPNAFKGPPSPAIDAAWDDITYASGKSSSTRSFLLNTRLTICSRWCYQC